jgi:LPXTG-site transpeptidase (sortase) family protein
MSRIMKIGSSVILVILFLTIFLQPQPVKAACAPDHIIYVASSGSGAGGCTWATAFPFLQDAIALATSGDQIWVASGTYYPDDGATQTNNSLVSTFMLTDGVSIYGGFTVGDTLLSQRDSNPATNGTVLSGDIDQIAGTAGNAYTVVTVNGLLTDTYLLDGFTISGGNQVSGSGVGGGMYIQNASPTLNNLIITANNASGRGGGVFIISVSAVEANYSRPSFTDVTVSNNTAGIGGGVYVQNGSPSFTRVTFSGNSSSGGAGGGLNVQTLGGPGVDEPNLPTLLDVTFSSNTAVGGGGMFNNNSNTTLNRVTFNGNTATRRGGGMLNEFSAPTLTNVTFSGNTSTETSGTTTPWGGGGIMNIGADPVLNNVTFNGNNSVNGSGTAGGDAMKNVTLTGNASTPVIENSILWGDGGTNDEVLNEGTSSATIEDSIVQGGCPALSTCTNVINSNPVLSALANNGGNTQTMAISVTGAADDAADTTTADCAATDQRGTARPQGVACDIGAYEIGDTSDPTLISFTRFNPPTSPTNADTLIFRATFDETVVNVSAGDFVVNGATTATITLVTQISGTVYEITVSGGDLAGFNGTVGLDLSGSQDITDSVGNALPGGEPATDETYVVDNTAPTVAIGAPSVALTNTGPVDFAITVTGANTINLTAGNVTLNTTGTATGAVSVTNGNTANPTVTISGITGDGTIGISIVAGIASDTAGNTSAAAGPSATFTVDNTAPTVAIGAPSAALTNTGPVDFAITVAGANTINLTAGDVTLNTTGTATGTVSVTNGNTANPTVTISGITGDGTIGISIVAGIASDTAGNTSAAAGPSATFTVDNTAPTVTIGAPSVALTNTGPVDFAITVAGANTINLTTGNVTLNTTGTATGTVSVTNGNTANPTVTISGITGDGTIGISIVAGIASDTAGNTSAAAGPSATFTVDNTAPTVTIGAPSVATTTAGPVDFSITISGANTINLTAGDVTLNTTGTATGTVSVTNGNTANPTVTISGITGDGTIGISIAAGIASDTAGNTSAAAGPSATFTVDNSGPVVTIGAPSTATTTSGPVNFSITITGGTTFNLLAANVTLNTTGTATGTVSVTNGNTATPTVTISGITGDGTIGISIAAGVAADGLGNPSAAAGPSATFTVDNTAPTVTIGAPSVVLTSTGPVDFAIAVAGASTVNLTAGNITLNTTGTATGTVSVTNGNTANPTVTISGITGNGTIGISIAAGIASDTAGNTSAAAGPSATFTVDNTAPTVAIGAPSVTVTSAGPVDFPITISGATTFNLTAGDVTLNTTGTATGTVSVTNGNTATPTVTISAITGNGTIGISIAAGVAADGSGNTSPAAGPSTTFTVDNSGPTVTASVPANASSVTGPTQLTVTYNEDVKNDGSAGAANNVVNYLLVEAGVNTTFDTVSCLGGLVADDTVITINTTTYTNNGGSGPFVATLDINGGIALPVGTYQLYVCGTTSIENLVNLELNDGLADTIIQFTVTAGPGGGGGTNLRASAVPATGFAQGLVTTLPAQPAEKMYAATSLWIEIPRLGVKMDIVGVPQTRDGWDVSWLGRDAGWLNGSAFPTWNGNSVITGHVWTEANKPGPFNKLKDLQYGDQIKIHAFGQMFIYEIRDSALISSSDTKSMMKHEEKTWLTLVTCEGFNSKTGEYLYRRMVRAVLVSVTADR